MGSSFRVLLLLVLGLFLAMSLGAEVAVGFEGESRIYYESLLDRFGAAWNDHDAEALISTNCVARLARLAATRPSPAPSYSKSDDDPSDEEEYME